MTGSDMSQHAAHGPETLSRLMATAVLCFLKSRMIFLREKIKVKVL